MEGFESTVQFCHALRCLYENSTLQVDYVRFSNIVDEVRVCFLWVEARYHMDTTFPNKAEFDAKLSQMEALARDWAERECSSFDAAVRREVSADEGGGSIWDMPAIDSKRTVSLLVELEPLLGCRLPSSLIKRGGYLTIDEVVADLPPKIRRLCPDATDPVLAAITPPTATSTTALSKVMP